MKNCCIQDISDCPNWDLKSYFIILNIELEFELTDLDLTTIDISNVWIWQNLCRRASLVGLSLHVSSILILIVQFQISDKGSLLYIYNNNINKYSWIHIHTHSPYVCTFLWFIILRIPWALPLYVNNLI